MNPRSLRYWRRLAQSNFFSVKVVAAKQGGSRRKLYRFFKKYFGCPPKILFRRVRLCRAVLLLCAKRFSIKEIAFKVGYSSASVFVRAFRRVFKISPGEFLKRYVSPNAHPLRLLRAV